MVFQKLGKYELLEKIDRRGYGTVYRTRETVPEVERAVKLLHPALVADTTTFEHLYLIFCVHFRKSLSSFG